MSKKSIYFFDNKYNNMTDEELIKEIRLGDLTAQNFLLEKYRNLVNMKANRFFLVGAENDDMLQEVLEEEN